MSMDSSIGELRNDPNFGLILIGALMWILGGFVPFISPFITTIGFGLVCTASAITSLKRSSENALFGLILGGIIQIGGYYMIAIIPLIGLIIGPVFVAIGGVLIIFFAIPLAIQTGRVPFLQEFQDKMKGKSEWDEKVVDAEVVDDDSDS